MKKIVALLLIFSLSLCGCASNSATTVNGADKEHIMTWQEQYDLGVRYLSEGNYEEAIIAFTAAIEIDPKQAPAYAGRGDAYNGVAQLSMTSIEEDAELTEDAASAYNNAIADYLKALDLDGSVTELYKKAAEVYVQLGDTEAAVEILERGIAVTESAELQEYLDELVASLDYVVQWVDPTFESMARMIIDKPAGDIMRSELDGISSIYIYGDQYAGVDSPVGESGFRCIRHEQASDPEGILTALYMIGGVEYTERGGIYSIEDIVHFRNLDYVLIIANHVSDLTPLLTLEHLSAAIVWGNDINDLGILGQLGIAQSFEDNSEQFVEIGDILPLHLSED